MAEPISTGDYLIFDIGGTKMRLALTDGQTIIGEPQIIPTPATWAEGLTVIRDFIGAHPVRALAGGIAGTWDATRTKLLASPHLPAWVAQPIRADLAAIFNGPIFLENDAAVVGLGEALVGAGRGAGIVAYLTISTGVGGARIVNGRIDEHSASFEPGRQIIDWREPVKKFEDYVSGTAVAARTGQPAPEVHDPELWAELSRQAAILVSNTIDYWSPDMIVLGGSMLGNPGLYVAVIKEEVDRLNRDLPHPPIVRAILGDLGGLHGAIEFLKQNL